MAQAKRAAPVVVDQISRSILILRGQRVILDRELAAIYGSTTKRLNEQIKRNSAFPKISCSSSPLRRREPPR